MDSERRHHFEREVPTYAEPVTAGDLKEGEIYFSVQFVDESLLLPILETLVFTGREKGDDGSTILRFQDLQSYSLGIQRGSPEGDCATFYAQPEQNLKHIFEYDRALDRLIDCSLRRQRAKR